MKQKKPQQALVWKSPRKNPTEVRQKGWMDRRKQPMEPLDLDKDEMTMGVEDINAEEVVPITQQGH